MHMDLVNIDSQFGYFHLRHLHAYMLPFSVCAGVCKNYMNENVCVHVHVHVHDHYTISLKKLNNKATLLIF